MPTASSGSRAVAFLSASCQVAPAAGAAANTRACPGQCDERQDHQRCLAGTEHSPCSSQGNDTVALAEARGCRRGRNCESGYRWHRGRDLPVRSACARVAGHRQDGKLIQRSFLIINEQESPFVPLMLLYLAICSSSQV